MGELSGELRGAVKMREGVGRVGAGGGVRKGGLEVTLSGITEGSGAVGT